MRVCDVEKETEDGEDIYREDVMKVGEMEKLEVGGQK
jgi:hypothetical protein